MVTSPGELDVPGGSWGSWLSWIVHLVPKSTYLLGTGPTFWAPIFGTDTGAPEHRFDRCRHVTWRV